MKEILITSSVMILAVMILRFLFRTKVNRRLVYGVWLLVALRLLVPIQFGQLDFSVLTQAKPVTDAITDIAQRPVSGPSREELYQDALRQEISQGAPVFIPEVQDRVDTEIQQSGRPAPEVYEEFLETNRSEEILLPEVSQKIEVTVTEKAAPNWGQIALWVWLAGSFGMAGWFLGVNISLRRSLRRSAADFPAECPIPVKVSAAVSSPCLFGLLRPTIYLTPACIEDEQHLRHVLTHEQTHLRHGDHIWAWVRCLCLCIYWFNPLVWAAAYLSKRDCELACDEAALKTLGEEERLAYGKTLVDMVASHPAPGQLLETATAMHETKKQLKERVNRIVKKPKVFLTAAIALLLVLTIVTGCAFSGAAIRSATGPSDTTQPTTTPPTTAPSDPTTVPTDPTTTPTEPPVTDEVAEFQKLFLSGDDRNPYRSALSCEFSDPTELSLGYYFGSGFRGEYTATEAELEELKQYTPNKVKSFYRLPQDKMEEELQKYFGISLTDLSDRAFHGLFYLESSASYCHIYEYRSNAATTYTVRRVEHMSDGTIRVEYTINNLEKKNVLTLKPNGEDYLILSNEYNVIDDPVLAKYNALFEQEYWERNPYLYALGHEYSNLKELKLLYFFDGGFDDESPNTDAEKAELKQYYRDDWVNNSDLHRLPRSKMNAELQKIFGITLKDLPDTAYQGLVYLESTDCYYFLATGVYADIGGFTIKSVNENSNGTVSVTYAIGTGSLPQRTRIVTLKPNGDSYLVLSNLPISAYTPADAPPLANIPIINQTAILPKNPTVEDLLLEPYTGSVLWFDEHGNEYDIDIELPLLVPFCDGAKAINEAIRNEFQSRIDQINDNYIARIGEFERTVYYEAYLNGNVLSVIITRDSALDHNAYHTYNLDISTGKQLSIYDMAQRFAGASYPEFLMHATYTAYDYLYHYYASKGSNPQSLLDDFEHDTITMQDYKLALDADGTLILYNGYNSTFMRTVVVPFDPTAHSAEFSGGEKDAYQWLFTRNTDGTFSKYLGSFLANSFFLDPDAFLRYLSQQEGTLIQEIAASTVSGVSEAGTDQFTTLCNQYLSNNATAKAAKALLDALEK